MLRWYADAEKERPQTPSAASDGSAEEVAEDDKIYVEVTLRGMGGRQLGRRVVFKLFGDDGDQISSLGALIALGRAHENPDLKYSYLFSLVDGSMVDCSKHVRDKIRRYADDLHPIAVDELSPYDPDSRVHSLVLQQVADDLEEPEAARGAEGR